MCANIVEFSWVELVGFSKDSKVHLLISICHFRFPFHAHMMDVAIRPPCHIMHYTSSQSQNSINRPWVLFKWAQLTGYFLTPCALWPLSSFFLATATPPPNITRTAHGGTAESSRTTRRRGSNCCCVRQRPPRTNLTGRQAQRRSRNATFHAASETKTESETEGDGRRRRHNQRVGFGIGNSWVHYMQEARLKEGEKKIETS